MKVQEQQQKAKDKIDNNKKKLKKFNELTTQSKRQQGLLEQRVKESSQLKMDLSQMQAKLHERERVHQ
jgi:hypothetical protein